MSTVIAERMAVDIDGNGDAVVYLHGLGGSSNVFTPQVQALGKSYRSLRPDLPGAARSPLSGAVSIASLVDQVARLVLALGVQKAHFVGHSMGTIVCQHLAVQQPQLVRSLALFGPILSPPDQARTGLKARAAKAREEGMAEIADQVAAAATSNETKANNLTAIALVRELLMRQSGEGYAAHCEALAAAEAADLGRISCPVLLVAGDEDVVAPVSMARLMSERLATARLTVLNRCGHWLTIEKAAESNAALKEFLTSRI